MSLLATRVIEAFLLPPLSLILLGVLGLVLLRRRPRLGGVLVFIALGLFYVASLPPVARVLTASLEECRRHEASGRCKVIADLSSTGSRSR